MPVTDISPSLTPDFCVLFVIPVVVFFFMRLIYLPSVMLMLERQKNQQEDWAGKAGAAWDNSMNLVFTNELGQNLRHVTIYKHFKAVVKELGIDSMRFHDLRHTFAVVSLESGDDIKTLQDNMGHATSAFTLDTYGHSNLESTKDATVYQ